MYWTTHLPGSPRLACHDAVSIKTNIFVFGNPWSHDEGLSHNSFKPIDVHVLDTVKMKWLYLNLDKDQDWKLVPSISFGHTVVAHNSKIYLWGGHNYKELSDTLYCYDTDTLKWSTPIVNGDIPPARIGHSACIIRNCMYIHSGLFYEMRIVEDLHMIDLDTMKWSTVKTTGNSPCNFAHTATAINDNIYVFGGAQNDCHGSRSNERIIYSELYCLDTTTREWKRPTVGGFKPLARCFHSAFSHNGFLYIFGGIFMDMSPEFQGIHQYDPKTSTWAILFPKGCQPCSRKGMISTVVNDRVYISGGINSVPTKVPNQPNTQFIKYLYQDNVHVLDLNPSLFSMCLVNAWNHLKDNEINVKDLCIPLSVKKCLADVDPKKIN